MNRCKMTQTPKPKVPPGLAQNAEEQDRLLKLRSFCHEAFLGAGLISVVTPSDEPQVRLVLTKYNRARGDHKDLVKTISAMMKRNICFSAAHPLVAAVNKSLIDTDTLSKYEPANSGEEVLQRVRFLNTQGEITILNGRQRVLAAQQAFTAIASQKERLQAHICVLQEWLGGMTVPTEQRTRAKLDQATSDLGHMEQTLKNIELWPVYFYDEGKLRLIPQEVQDFPGGQNDPEVLLRFLSENPQEPSQPKIPDERLADILFRNLYNRQPVKSWSHLISDNRILQNTCYRPRLWDMVVAVMQVSPLLLGTNVTSGSVLYTHASNHCLGALASITTLVMKRTMKTFSSCPVPGNFLQKWQRLLTASEEAHTMEQRAWASHRAVWKRTPQPQFPEYEDYQKGLEQLLKELSHAKKALSTEARQFEALSAIPKQAWATIYERHPVFVPDEALEEIDNIYIKHYRAEHTSEDDVNQLLCLSCCRCSHSVAGEGGIPACQTTLQNYLRDVKEYLETHPTLEGLSEDNPQRVGVANAATRLQPLHMPIGVPGSLTLPLASRSMLQDLWTYIVSTDGGIAFEVSRWFDGLGRHMISLKGGKGSAVNRVHSYLDVVRNKVQSMTEDLAQKDTLAYIALQEIFAKRLRFDVFTTALTQAKFPAVLSSKDLEATWGNNKNLESFAKAVHTRLQTVKGLSNMSLPAAKEPFERLVSETAYNVSSKVSDKALRQICMFALDEASDTVCEARRELLKTEEAMALRQNLWLAINRELVSNPRTVNGSPRRFTFWDRVPDSLTASGIGKGLYPEEVAVEAGKCLEDDARDLRRLGDFLTTCRALVNNRDAPSSSRVIEQDTKALIDALLEHSRKIMDRQRMLRFQPEDHPANDQDNPFERVGSYTHRQQKFKSFSDFEVQSQAGIDTADTATAGLYQLSLRPQRAIVAQPPQDRQHSGPLNPSPGLAQEDAQQLSRYQSAPGDQPAGPPSPPTSQNILFTPPRSKNGIPGATTLTSPPPAPRHKKRPITSKRTEQDEQTPSISMWPSSIDETLFSQGLQATRSMKQTAPTAWDESEVELSARDSASILRARRKGKAVDYSCGDSSGYGYEGDDDDGPLRIPPPEHPQIGVTASGPQVDHLQSRSTTIGALDHLRSHPPSSSEDASRKPHKAEQGSGTFDFIQNPIGMANTVKAPWRVQSGSEAVPYLDLRALRAKNQSLKAQQAKATEDSTRSPPHKRSRRFTNDTGIRTEGSWGFTSKGKGDKSGSKYDGQSSSSRRDNVRKLTMTTTGQDQSEIQNRTSSVPATEACEVKKMLADEESQDGMDVDEP